MKVTLVVLGLVLFVALAECMPAEKPTVNLLKTRILEKLAARGKKVEHKSAGDSDEEKEEQQSEQESEEEEEEEEEDDNWPYGWMEFAALYAKCESGKLMIEQWGEYIDEALESAGTNVKESLLYNACPDVMAVGKTLMEADEEGRIAAEPYLANGLPLTQCANLIADKESLSLLLFLSGEDYEKSEFLREAQVLFNICNKVFTDFEDDLEENEEEAVEAVESEAAKRSLKMLLAHVKK